MQYQWQLHLYNEHKVHINKTERKIDSEQKKVSSQKESIQSLDGIILKRTMQLPITDSIRL